MSPRNRLAAVLAPAVLLSPILILGACNKTPASRAPADASGGAATATPPVADAEDRAAAVVGQVSAATTMTAQGFVDAAAISDMYEIQAAKIAARSSSNADVKAFAAHMIQDHSRSAAKLQALLGKGDIHATAPPDLDERRKVLLDNLNAAKPEDFDKTYVDQQVAAHQEAVTLFKGYADHGDNNALKAFAASVLPTIQNHLAMAKDLRSSLR
jgi:putative membrane protein